MQVSELVGRPSVPKCPEYQITSVYPIHGKKKKKKGWLNEIRFNRPINNLPSPLLGAGRIKDEIWKRKYTTANFPSQVSHLLQARQSLVLTQYTPDLSLIELQTCVALAWYYNFKAVLIVLKLI